MSGKCSGAVFSCSIAPVIGSPVILCAGTSTNFTLVVPSEFVVNYDGTISPLLAPDLALGFQTPTNKSKQEAK